MVRGAIVAMPRDYWVSARDLGARRLSRSATGYCPAMPRIADAVNVGLAHVDLHHRRRIRECARRAPTVDPECAAILRDGLGIRGNYCDHPLPAMESEREGW